MCPLLEGSGSYNQQYKDIIVNLFRLGMSLWELSSEYGIAKSIINGWIKNKNLILKKLF